MRVLLRLFLFTVIIWAMTASCMRGNKVENQAPTTKIFLESINRTGDNRLNSNVFLSWFGTDIDGYVVGYEISFDNVTWEFTTRTDSVFRFTITQGSDTSDIDFWVRAIDQEGLKDPQPAYLSVPLKNTPPETSLDAANGPADTALIAATFRWQATDLDGNETVNQVRIKVNQGEWFTIPRNSTLFSIVLDKGMSAGIHEARVYIDNETSALAEKITGVNYNGENEVYIQARDVANSQSNIDTSDRFVLLNSNSDLLVVSAQPGGPKEIYTPILNQITTGNGGYDIIDFTQDGGKYQPKFWLPTMRLILNEYEKLFVFTDPSNYTNPATGQTANILAFFAPVIANYNATGGKSLITTTLTANADLTALSIAYPIDGVVTSGGQARLTGDSSIVPQMDANLYPSMRPSFTLSGIVPIVRSPDSEVFYRAQLTKLQNWQGDNTVGVRRKNNLGQVQQVFFGVNLHQFANDGTKLQEFLDQILNEDFDW